MGLFGPSRKDLEIVRLSEKVNELLDSNRRLQRQLSEANDALDVLHKELKEKNNPTPKVHTPTTTSIPSSRANYGFSKPEPVVPVKKDPERSQRLYDSFQEQLPQIVQSLVDDTPSKSSNCDSSSYSSSSYSSSKSCSSNSCSGYSSSHSSSSNSCGGSSNSCGGASSSCGGSS